MGIAAIAAVFIFHFANRSLKGKLLFGVLGILAFIMVFNSKAIPGKDILWGSWHMSDLTLNYYDNPDYPQQRT